jgi:DNA repair protein RecO (recombination protein O)
MLHTTEAFVLRTYSLAEADKICIFLTRNLGKVRGVAHGARKMKSRFGSALEPFTEVTLTYFHKEGRDLVSVSNCEIIRSNFDSAARDVETAFAFSYLAELLTEFLPDHESNENLYRLVSATLEAIAEGGEMGRLLCYFESWLLRLVGFFPDTSRCSACGTIIIEDDITYLTAEGSPRCAACSNSRGTMVDSELRSAMRYLFRSHPREFARAEISSKHISRMNEITYHIIRRVLEKDLRSREILRQLVNS